jgi:hypothetical protein
MINRMLSSRYGTDFFGSWMVNRIFSSVRVASSCLCYYVIAFILVPLQICTVATVVTVTCETFLCKQHE